MSRSRLPSCPVTAYSLVNALGTTTDEVLEAIRSGKSGLSTSAGHLPFATHWGKMADDLPSLPGELRRYDTRVARIAWAALEPLLGGVRDAISRRGPERMAVIVGSSTGGIAESERAYGALAAGEPLPPEYSFVLQHSFGGLVSMIVAATGARGPAYAVSTACASSAKVFGVAQRLLATGVVDSVLVGGADSLCQTTLRGFAGLKVLSASPCRPFDPCRAGISIGEGAAFVLLERDAKADLHLLSVGETSDAHHMTAPHPDGQGAILAMQEALDGAGRRPADVGYVNAHGTGTESNDAAEARAIHAVLGPDVPVSSTKGTTGHLLGAAGATEAVICLDVLAQGKVPPNVGCEGVDAGVAIHVVKEPLERRVQVALSNSFAFGGCNTTLAFGTEPAAALPLPARTVDVAGAAFWAPGFPGGSAALASQAVQGAEEPAAALLPTRARGRASMLTRMSAEIVGQLTEGGGVDLRNVPIVLGSAGGEMGTTLVLLEALSKGEPLLSPLRFPGSVHNAALGALSIQTGNRSFSTALAAGTETPAMALVEATAWLRAHGGDVLVVLAEEAAPVPLWRGTPFGPLAYGFWLRAAEGGGGPDSRRDLMSGWLSGGARAAGALRSRYLGHPLEAGLDLVETVLRR